MTEPVDLAEMAPSEKASTVANAAALVRNRLVVALGGSGDIRTLARLVDVSPEALAWRILPRPIRWLWRNCEGGERLRDAGHRI